MGNFNDGPLGFFLVLVYQKSVEVRVFNRVFRFFVCFDFSIKLNKDWKK